MANLAHILLLTKGADAWNHWRALHPNVEVDLSGANLHGDDLHGAKLSHADLRGLPWLFIFALMITQPDANFTGIQWDRLTEEQGEPSCSP